MGIQTKIARLVHLPCSFHWWVINAYQIAVLAALIMVLKHVRNATLHVKPAVLIKIYVLTALMVHIYTLTTDTVYMIAP